MAEAKKPSICHLLWKQDACCTSKDVPMQEISVLSFARIIHLTVLLATALCPSPSFCLGWFFWPFVILPSCPGLLLSFITCTLSNANTYSQPAQLLSAQEGDTLLISTDWMAEVLFPKLKRNTCTNNIPKAPHSSWGDWTINVWRWKTQSNLKMYVGQLIKDSKCMPILKGESRSKDFSKIICSIRHVTSQNTSEIRMFSKG